MGNTLTEASSCWYVIDVFNPLSLAVHLLLQEFEPNPCHAQLPTTASMTPHLEIMPIHRNRPVSLKRNERNPQPTHETASRAVPRSAALPRSHYNTQALTHTYAWNTQVRLIVSYLWVDTNLTVVLCYRKAGKRLPLYPTAYTVFVSHDFCLPVYGKPSRDVGLS